MKIPLGQRGQLPLRSLETLRQNYSQFMAGGGDIKNAKFDNNVISRAFFDTPLTQVRMAIEQFYT